MRRISVLTGLLLISSPLLSLADPGTTYQSTSTTTVIVTLSSVTAWNTVTATGTPPASTTSSSTSTLVSSSGSSIANVYPAAATQQGYPFTSSNLTSNGTGSAQPSGFAPPLRFTGAANAHRSSFAVAISAGCVVAALGAAL